MSKRSRLVWERAVVPPYQFSQDEEYYFKHLEEEHPKYKRFSSNRVLDIDSKKAVLKVSPSIVALVSYSGEKELAQCSGTIVETDESDNTFVVLTSASLVRPSTEYPDDIAENILAPDLQVIVHASDNNSYKGDVCGYDFHYNLLALKFKANASLPVAKIRSFDDRLSLSSTEEKSFQLRPHSTRLVPGDMLIAVGRYFAKPFNIMTAPGRFSIDGCDDECKELFTVLCKITQCGDGGALINLSGELIGITFNGSGLWTSFLPINIARKWWEHYKMYRESRHPYLGFEATNMFAADVDLLERVSRTFPSISKGVLVELVAPGSSAHFAGLQQNDIIIKCGGNPAESFLELFDLMWNKVGESVELVVVRVDCSTFLTMNMMVVETPPDEFYGWRRYP